MATEIPFPTLFARPIRPWAGVTRSLAHPEPLAAPGLYHFFTGATQHAVQILERASSTDDLGGTARAAAAVVEREIGAIEGVRVEARLIGNVLRVRALIDAFRPELMRQIYEAEARVLTAVPDLPMDFDVVYP